MAVRLRSAVVAATAAAASIASGWFAAGYPTLLYDSLGYYFLTRWVRAGDIAHWPTDTWAYGYPFFATLVTGWRPWPPEEFRLIVFAAQLGVWLAVSAFAGRRLGSICGSGTVAVAAYALSALNPAPLVQTTEPLSDLLSAALILLAVALSWRTPVARPGGPSLSAPFLSFLCAAFATVVRPANAVVVAAVGAVWILRAAAFRDLRLRHMGAAVAGVAPPFLPQIAINRSTFGVFNPLVVKHLYALQATWGMRALKYAALVIPGRSPLLVYSNPFYRGDTSPIQFLARHPVQYGATLFFHAFAIVDRDLPFTYVTDLDPWYRLPLLLGNFLFLYLAAAGCGIGLARMAVSRKVDNTGFVVLSTTIVAAAYLALYLPVEVESRFGVALQALATPLIVAGYAAVRGTSVPRRRTRLAVILLAPVAVWAALTVSTWITRHRTNPPVGTAAVPARELRQDSPSVSCAA